MVCNIMVYGMANQSISTNDLVTFFNQFGHIKEICKESDNSYNITFDRMTSATEACDLVQLGGLNVKGTRLTLERLIPKEVGIWCERYCVQGWKNAQFPKNMVKILLIIFKFCNNKIILRKRQNPSK